jgi:hypothetical protein
MNSSPEVIHHNGDLLLWPFFVAARPQVLYFFGKYNGVSTKCILIYQFLEQKLATSSSNRPARWIGVKAIPIIVPLTLSLSLSLSLSWIIASSNFFLVWGNWENTITDLYVLKCVGII